MKEIEVGEGYVLQFIDEGGKKIVHAWEVIERYQTGNNSWHFSLAVPAIERTDPPLSRQQAEHFVNPFLSDLEPERRRVVVEKLTFG